MTYGKNPLQDGFVLLQSALATLAKSYAWAAATVLTVLVVLAFLDIFLSAFGIYIESIPLLPTLPIYEAATAWLVANMSGGFGIYHLLRPDTRPYLAFWWSLALVGSAAVYWH